MNWRFWLAGLLVAITASGSMALAQTEPAPPSTSEEDLLDFDSLDKAEGDDGTSEEDLTREEAPPESPKQLETPPPENLAEEAVPGEAAPTDESAEPPSEQQQAAPEAPAEPEPAPTEEPPAVAEEPAAPETTTPAPESMMGSSEPDPADVRKEKRLAKIGQRFLEPEISDEQWAGIVSTKGAPESYAIQAGDTLWDVSTKLFGDGFYWPKVWQLNDKITNPHFIAVGNTLKFIPGSTSEAPALDVEQPGDGEQAAPEIPLAEGQEEQGEGEPQDMNEIVIPPEKKRRSVLAKIPPSFPQWNQMQDGFDDDGFSVEKMPVRGAGALSLTVPAIISEQEWKPDGKVVEVRDGQEVAATYQSVVVSLPNAANAGDIYVAYSVGDEIKDPVTSDLVGYEIELRGELKIEGPVEADADSPEKNLFRALVLKATMPVRTGEQLKAGSLSRADLSAGGPASTVSARIVGSPLGQKVVGIYNVVFLNRGENDGLQKGMVLEVLKNTKLRKKDTVIKYESSSIGSLKVVEVGQKVATAYIVKESDAIMAGDETGVSKFTAENPASGSEEAPEETSEEELTE